MNALQGNDITAPIKLWPEDRTLLFMMTDKQVGQIIKTLCLMAQGLEWTPPKDQRLANAFSILAQRHILKTVGEWNRHCERGKKAADARWKNNAKALHNCSIAQASPMQCQQNASLDMDIGLRTINTVPFAQRTGKDDLRERVRKFADAVKSNGDDAFFGGCFDATTICLFLTDDFKSTRRWEQLVRAKGERKVVAEANEFWHETRAGEIPNNAGATLNARLSRLPDMKPTDKGGEA